MEAHDLYFLSHFQVLWQSLCKGLQETPSTHNISIILHLIASPSPLARAFLPALLSSPIQGGRWEQSQTAQETQLPTLQAHCSQLAAAPQPRQAPNFTPNPSVRMKSPGFTPVQLLGSGTRPKLFPAVQLMPVALLSRAQPVWEWPQVLHSLKPRLGR